MRKHFFFMLSISLLIASAGTAQAPQGAYKITTAQYGENIRTKDNSKEQVIKLFKDGYWMTAFYGDPDKPFSGSGGGTFTAKNGKYTERLQFFSWDSTAVGKVYTFDYKLTPDSYLQEGFINSDKYQNYIIKENFTKITAPELLKNTTLEGAWQLKEATWGEDKFGEGKYAGVEGIKIYAYPRFAWAYYNPATRQFLAAGGGTYQFDGKQLVEKLEYWSGFSFDNTTVVISIERNGKNQYAQNFGNNKEIWTRRQ